MEARSGVFRQGSFARDRWRRILPAPFTRVGEAPNAFASSRHLGPAVLTAYQVQAVRCQGAGLPAASMARMYARPIDARD